MSELFVRAFPWVRDALLAYAGGLAIGAPFAVVAAWLTGREQITTVVLLATMAALLVWLRRRPSTAGATVAAQPRGEVATTLSRRRVA